MSGHDLYKQKTPLPQGSGCKKTRRPPRSNLPAAGWLLQKNQEFEMKVTLTSLGRPNRKNY